MMNAAISSKTLAGQISRRLSGRAAAAANRARTAPRAAGSGAAFSSVLSPTASDLWREGAFVDGGWISAGDRGGGKSFDVLDPALDEVVATLPDMTAGDTAAAIDAAERAFSDEASPWKNMLAKERGAILRDLFLLHKDHERELAEILALESGKPLSEAVGEIRYGAGYFEWFAEEAKRIDGSIIPEPVPGRKLLAFKEPVGVCGLVTPWNFPNAMIARKLAPALAAGCTAVVKPAQDTPMSTLAIAALLERIGLPPGVLNVVTAGLERTPEVGSALTGDDRVRKISFTGSTRVGKLLMEQSAASVKKVSMELGGDAPLIVFEDADLGKALSGVMASKFRNAGQTCVASNRIFVHRPVYDEFAEMVTKEVNGLVVGRYDEPGVTMGPLINLAAVKKVDGIVQADVKAGATVATGGMRLLDQGSGHTRSNFFAPTVLTGCTDNMRSAKEEIFGPVIPLFSFETEEEVVRRANNTEAGLASYFFTKDAARIFRVAKALKYGMVGCNTGFMSDAVVPFGGVKHSGLGREGSKYGIDEYMHVKTLTLQHD